MSVDPHSSKAYVFLMTFEAVWLVVGGLGECSDFVVILWHWFLIVGVESPCALQHCSCRDLQWASGDSWESNSSGATQLVRTCSPQQMMNLCWVATPLLVHKRWPVFLWLKEDRKCTRKQMETLQWESERQCCSYQLHWCVTLLSALK